MSGFYYVETAEGTVVCRARGRFRLEKTTPLVGDFVSISIDGNGKGTVTEIMPRISEFVRPSVANIQLMVMVVSAVIPVTDTFLIDKIAAITLSAKCELLICINKTDSNPGDDLFKIYSHAGFNVLRTSTVSGEGIGELRKHLSGKICAFTGNSGVGKSSILNCLNPDLKLAVGDVSEKLGRGRHTTRHVELYPLFEGTYIADTPGFSSFEVDQMTPVPKEELQNVFPDFSAYLGQCRFNDCSHTKEQDCAILLAVQRGEIEKSRHESYVRLYEQAKEINIWQNRNYIKQSDLNKRKPI